MGLAIIPRRQGHSRAAHRIRSTTNKFNIDLERADSAPQSSKTHVSADRLIDRHEQKGFERDFLKIVERVKRFECVCVCARNNNCDKCIVKLNFYEVARALTFVCNCHKRLNDC